MKYRNAAEALPPLLTQLLTALERPSRNGATRELLHQQITLTDTTDPYITTPARRASLPAQIAETMWMLAGRDDIGWLSRYLPRAPAFSDDGLTWRGAYGKRLRRWVNPSGRTIDQLGEVIDLLTRTPDTRRAVAMVFDPTQDYVDAKDIPCNNWLHFIARDGELHLHVAVRSNDVMWGWSGINAFEWSVLTQVIAAEVGLKPGNLTFSTTSLHLYERHYVQAQRIIDASQSAHNDLDGPFPPDLRPSPIYDPGDLELDEAVELWFEVEAKIRANVPGVLREIEVFPEPLFRSWLHALYAWYHPGDSTFTATYGETTLWAALQDSPPRPDNAPPRPDPTEPFHSMVARLHEDKDKAYGGSWCKRGEQLSIIPNIARKIDRLGVAGAGDSAADTAIDLLVYLVKYQRWLRDDPYNTYSPVDDVELKLFRLAEQHEYSPRVDTVEAVTTALVHDFDDKLAPMAADPDSSPSDRLKLVDHMVVRSYWLAHELAEREGWTY